MTEMRNRDVVKRFVSGDFGHNGYGAVRSTEGGVLKSYKAKIAKWQDGEVVVFDGWDGYSPTTSKHFSFLKGELEQQDVARTATHEPEGKGRSKERWR